MKDLRDSVHPYHLCNVLLFVKAVHGNDKLFVTVLLAITASAAKAGFEAAEVV